jgi:hypothetical protein
MKKQFRNAGQAAFLRLLLFGAHLLLAQETVVAIRHAEKPLGGLGQLLCKSLNRALALPNVLTLRFGKPDAIYAPFPSPRILDELHLSFYARPLATIEPTTISLGNSVNTRAGYNKIRTLRTELTACSNRSKLILAAGAHGAE